MRPPCSRAKRLGPRPTAAHRTASPSNSLKQLQSDILVLTSEGASRDATRVSPAVSLYFRACLARPAVRAGESCPAADGGKPGAPPELHLPGNHRSLGPPPGQR